ncbi:MAG: hypothetical protein ACI8XC_000342 [Gammaproteobacteria bacterium]|jgi:hypothetical protein
MDAIKDVIKDAYFAQVSQIYKVFSLAYIQRQVIIRMRLRLLKKSFRMDWITLKKYIDAPWHYRWDLPGSTGEFFEDFGVEEKMLPTIG